MNVRGWALAGLCGLTAPAFAGGASAAAPPQAAIVRTVYTTGPHLESPWGLFGGQPWEAIVSDVMLSFELEAPVKLSGLRVHACPEPKWGATPSVSLLAPSGDALEVKASETDDENVYEYTLASPAPVGELQLTVDDADECIARLELLGPAGQPVPTRVVKPVAATASSPRTLGPGYEESRLFDGDPGTAWSTKGDGKGAELTVTLSEPHALSSLQIWPGYHRSDELWKQNAMPSKVSVSVNGGPAMSFTLPEKMEVEPPTRLVLPAKVTAKTVTLRIDEVRPGTKYKDTLISELRFYDGDQPFVPDPTPAYVAARKALRAKLAPAGLEGIVDGRFVSDDNVWHVAFLADGRFFLRRAYTKDTGADVATMSHEVKKVGKGQVELRVYGSVLHVPVANGQPDWDKKTEKTFNGRLVVTPAAGGRITLALKGKGAAGLEVPTAPLKPAFSPVRAQLAEAGLGGVLSEKLEDPSTMWNLTLTPSGKLRLQRFVEDAGGVGYTGDVAFTVKDTTAESATLQLDGKVLRSKYEGTKLVREKDPTVEISGPLIISRDAAGYRLTVPAPLAKTLALPEGLYKPAK